MSRFTKEQVIAERRCGLKYFDVAVAKVGRTTLIQQSIDISRRHPDVWGPGWSNFSWAIGNAVIDQVESKGDISQTWNIDEALNTEEMKYVANELKIDMPYIDGWKRLTKPRVSKLAEANSDTKLSSDFLKEYLTKLFRVALADSSNPVAIYFNANCNHPAASYVDRVKSEKWSRLSKKRDGDSWIREYNSYWGPLSVKVHSDSQDAKVIRVDMVPNFEASFEVPLIDNET